MPIRFQQNGCKQVPTGMSKLSNIDHSSRFPDWNPNRPRLALNWTLAFQAIWAFQPIRSDVVKKNSNYEFERLLGRAALALWPDLPRDVQESLFETAVAGDDIIRNHLASYLHDHHPRTAHPTRPTRLA
jgi:hypothetical protein